MASYRLAAAAALAAVTAGCTVEAFTYTVDRYGTVKARQLRLGCDDTYEVYDRGRGALLAVTHPLNEEALGACGGVAGLPKAERLRRVARIYLEETTDRPECAIRRETEMTPLHTEFEYRCPAPRAARAAFRPR
jgi:hypothetical protein